MRAEERAIACLKGLATGDAIGKQSETLSYTDVKKWYPEVITGFHGQLGDVIPRYAGKRYEWKIGETTDDTEQTLAVARAILTDQDVRHISIGRELFKCVKSIHPGVSMWSFVQSGDPSRMATGGDGCGAAMRVSPVGIFHSSSQLDRIVNGAYECSIPTHGGQSGICAAAAVAAAVSAALDGQAPAQVLAASLAAARAAEPLASCRRPRPIADSIAAIYGDLSTRVPLHVGYVAERYFPNTPESIVPLAICLALITESAEQTILIAANIGGDSDSVASIGGAVAGALRPETINDGWYNAVRTVNKDDLNDVAVALLRLRK